MTAVCPGRVATTSPCLPVEPASGRRSGRAVFDVVSREISARDFQLFQTLIYRKAGIWLSTSKVALLTGRLAKRLRHHKCSNFKEYYALVLDSPEEQVQMLDAISTNETHFFREPQHFEFLKAKIFPQWQRDEAARLRGRNIRVLSAGCSTGQEPYSLAMMLLAHFPPGCGWNIEIVATDLSTRALEIARKGIWPMAKAAEIPHDYLRQFMLKGFGEQHGKLKAGPEIRSVIQFLRLNLNDASYLLPGKFDLIFCRNVLIYFDTESRRSVVRRLASYLAESGHFFVGHAESLHQMGDVLTTVVPTVYTSARRKLARKFGERDARI